MKKHPSFFSHAPGASYPDVYLLQIPQYLPDTPLTPAERDAEVRSTAHPTVRRERYWVWRTLLYALTERGMPDPSSLTFVRSPEGKWSCAEVCFSLSHSHGLAVVVVSDHPVGADVENLSEFSARADVSRRIERLSHRICAPSDRFPASPLDFLALWTQKESIFKCEDQRIFHPSRLPVDRYPLKTFTYREWIISVCGQGTGNMRVFAWDGDERSPRKKIVATYREGDAK